MRVTVQHWEVFLNMCEKCPHLITNKFNGAQGKAEGNALWQNVAAKLNGLGLGKKSVAEWRRAVTDWKSKVKAKASKIKLQATQTGGGPFASPPLTPLEERLISLMGKKGFEGDEGINELGLPSRTLAEPRAEPITELTCQNVLQEIIINEHAIQPSTSQYTVMDEVLQTKDTSITSNNKRKFNEQTISQDHDYSGERKMNKRVKRKNITRISKNLEDMTAESLSILKNIDRNTSRIADSLEKTADSVAVLPQLLHQFSSN